MDKKTRPIYMLPTTDTTEKVTFWSTTDTTDAYICCLITKDTHRLKVRG